MSNVTKISAMALAHDMRQVVLLHFAVNGCDIVALLDAFAQVTAETIAGCTAIVENYKPDADAARTTANTFKRRLDDCLEQEIRKHS